jgi:hypothetical protein
MRIAVIDHAAHAAAAQAPAAAPRARKRFPVALEGPSTITEI